ncbi:sirohydrochlorin cobaltochelatase [uncultured Bacteroides sp.]|uniref:sirohydrochlorin cobaltochelatase n=1 Tax=uncultured Bacteroides sp. TaxID=162156 RepID=UPI00267714C5|nr:sirohydrochlorin cobaltochelatase [uncultured Bacteroides sp.]
MRKIDSLLIASAMVCGTMCMVSCSDDDDNSSQGSTANPVEEIVARSKTSNTAVLLCTFGSTFQESIKTYDAIIADYKAAFPNTDVYLSFTSRTCVNRVKSETGVDRYQPDLWLDAIGKAGYERLAVQSLHVIPGEEYLSLMNTDVKKNFMIAAYPSVKVLKGENLLASQEDVDEVADILYESYKDVLKDKKNVLLFVGHGNPDVNYSHANEQYTNLETAMLELADNGNVFVGTVDYGSMLFYPELEKEDPTPADEEIADTYIYKKLRNYCSKNDLNPSDITVHLTSIMSIAGDHAHNDLWGLEDDDSKVNEATPRSDYSWRLKLTNMGFTIDQTESHHGSVDNCTIKGLGDYADIRSIWLSHLKDKYNNEDEWETGEDYQ